MNTQLDYSCTVKTLPFLYIETVKAGRLLAAGHTAEDIKAKAINKNLFQLKTEARKKEVAVMVLKRLAVLDTFLLDKLVTGTGETAKQLVLYTIMKTDRLFFEFMREVFQDKLIVKQPYIGTGDFSFFFPQQSGTERNSSCLD
ncbi:hypothetical protein SCACP_37060 [Sporomusa carbonis]|uniref:DUF1819 family protein n=1 Tax=Sporomusa carbonis TaxID=3076075 RepID=UPI003A707D64